MKPLFACLLFGTLPLFASNDPNQAAVAHLEKIRDGSIDLKPGGDTAIAPQTGDGKREEIAQRIKRMALDLSKDPLAAGSSKIDGNLAAVLVGQCPGHDFDAYRVTAVALVRKSDAWLAAPLPGSFENSGIPFDPAIRESAKILENWMIEQQTPELDKLRELTLEQLRARIDHALPRQERLTMDAAQCAERFLMACLKKDLPSIAGLLGGGSSTLPDDWNQRLKAADQATKSGGKPARHWRLLMAPEVLRIRMESNSSATRAHMRLACLDPAGIPPKFTQPEMEEITLNLVKTQDGSWIVNLPREFLTPNTPDAPSPPAEPIASSQLDILCRCLAEQYPPIPETDPMKARDALLTAFRSGSPASSWAGRLSRHNDGKDACDALTAAASAWRAFNLPPAVHHPVPLGGHGNKDRHGFVFQLFSILNPDQLDLRELHFVKTNGGWLWDPSPAENSLADFRAWKKLNEKEWKDSWRQTLLDECPTLDEIAGTEAPSEDEARLVVEHWMRALRQGDIRAAIRLTTRLPLPDSGVTLLRNLGYETNSIRANQTEPTVGGVLRADPWALVGMKPEPGKPTAFPCFPVVRTAGGPKILLETDLLASDNRSRQYLNKISLKRLGKSNPGISSTLEKLFSDLSTKPPDHTPPVK